MNTTRNTDPLGGLYFIIWLVNLCYVAATWHNGWATLANVFVPYGLPYDMVVKFVVPLMAVR